VRRPTLNSKEIDASRLDAKQEQEEGFETIEAAAVKKIVRENWESKLKKKGSSVDILNEHAEFMSKEIGAADYETLCMQNIAMRAKHMSMNELLVYTKTIEAVALGYKTRFGMDLGGLLVAGVTLMAKDVKSARNYLDYFNAHLIEDTNNYDRMIGRESRTIRRMDSKLRITNSGIFRFLRKKEIARLQSGIRKREIRISKLEARKSRYSTLATKVKSRADMQHGKKI